MYVIRQVKRIANIPKVRRLEEEYKAVTARYRRELASAIHNKSSEKVVNDIDSIYLAALYQINRQIAELS